MPRITVAPHTPALAADFNTVSDQSVMVFATAAARTAAIPTPVAGMHTYQSDTKRTEFYTGTAWVPVGTAIISNAGTFLGTRDPNRPLAISAGLQSLTIGTGSKITVPTLLTQFVLSAHFASWRSAPDNAPFQFVPFPSLSTVANVIVQVWFQASLVAPGTQAEFSYMFVGQ